MQTKFKKIKTIEFHEGRTWDGESNEVLVEKIFTVNQDFVMAIEVHDAERSRSWGWGRVFMPRATFYLKEEPQFDLDFMSKMLKVQTKNEDTGEISTYLVNSGQVQVIEDCGENLSIQVGLKMHLYGTIVDF